MLDADFEVARRDFPVAASFRLDAGERLALLGPSGAGKTTILEAIAGFLPLCSGRISLGGRVLSSARGTTVPPRHRRVGLVGQGSSLFPHLTVLQNIRYGPHVSTRTALRWAHSLGLTATLGSRPAGLSEGEKRRAALARALAAGCQLLCLDEPFSALERNLADDLLERVREEVGDLSGGAILVTHRLEEAQAFADRIGVMDHGQVIQMTSPQELLRHPRTPTVARLMGYRGWLTGPRGQLAVHPELCSLEGPAEVTLGCRVTACRPMGARFDVTLAALGEWRGRVHVSWSRPLEVGSQLAVAIPSAVVFPEAEPGLG